MAEVANNKCVLYAILDWGLGHATRSIPLIRALQSKGYTVVVCSEDKIADFLNQELREVVYENLTSYNISYRYDSMAKNMLLQLPKIYKSFIQENRLFKKLVKKYNPIFTISDNRYGCRSDIIPAYFLGHQWSILNRSGDVHHFASKVNQYFIGKFDFMIIPDTSTHYYSGKLSMGIPKDFVLFSGLLSRFTKTEYFTDQKKYDVGIILSGPEPSRTKLEQKLLQLFEVKKEINVLLIRGTQKNLNVPIPSNVDVKDLVNSAQLSGLIDACKTVVSRSGYSSIMDYIRLGVEQMVFIPTNGQTEQEYLADFYEQHYDVPQLKTSEINKLIDVLGEIKNKSLKEKMEISLYQLVETIESQVVN